MCAPTYEKLLPDGSKLQRQMEAEEKNNQIQITHQKTKLELEQKLKDGTRNACLSVILLISAWSLMMPHMQARRDTLQCDSFCLGSMNSARSMLTLVGSAFMGRLSDSQSIKFSMFGTVNGNGNGNGRMLCLYIGTLATFLGFAISASTFSIQGMWLGMIPGSLLQHNYNVFKAMLADYHEEISQFNKSVEGEKNSINKSDAQSSTSTNDENENENENENGNESDKDASSSERAGSVGKLGMSVGIAFMLGPLVGATIVKSYRGAVMFAMVLTSLSTIFIAKMPHIEKSSVEEEKQMNSNSAQDTNNENRSIWSTLGSAIDVKSARSPSAIFLITIRVSMALAFHIFNTIWTVSLKKRFDFGPSDHGKFMSFVGFVFAFSQGFAAKRMLAPLSRKGRVRLLQACCVALGVGRVVAYQVDSLAIVYVMFGLIVTALGVVNTVLTADTCLIATSAEIGGLFGVLEAAQSGAGMVGPLIGGALAKIHPVTAPLAAVVFLYIVVFFLVAFGYEKLLYRQQNEKDETSEESGKASSEIKKEM